MTARSEAKEGRCLGALPAGPGRTSEADLTGLGGGDRAAWYLEACGRAGIDPAERPFAVRRVAGREALVAVAGAAARMAASRGVALATVAGPEAVVLGGVVLVKVVCRATAPDGRAEEATATVPWAHPTRSEALCVARARARATLSLLGIAALDESDLQVFSACDLSTNNGAPARARRLS